MKARKSKCQMVGRHQLISVNETGEKIYQLEANFSNCRRRQMRCSYVCRDRLALTITMDSIAETISADKIGSDRRNLVGKLN